MQVLITASQSHARRMMRRIPSLAVTTILIGLHAIVLVVIGLVAIGLPAANLWAQATPAPSTPAHPSVPEDQLSPRGAVKVLRTSLLKGDANALLSLVQTTTPEQDTVLHLFAENLSLQASIRRAVYGKFPAAVPDPMKLADDQIAMSNPAIDAMRESVTADSAIVFDASPTAATNPSQQMKMTRIDGKWKIPFEVIQVSLPVDPSEHDFSMLIQRLRTENPVLKKLGADINAGMFKTTKELEQAGRDRMLKALAEALANQPRPAATAPSTRP